MRNFLKARFHSGLGLARVGLVLLLAATLVVVLSVRATVARADDAMMDLGRHLIALSEAGLGIEQRSVLLNGQQLGFRVFTVAQEMNSTLDFYEAWCHGKAGEFANQAANLSLLDTSPSPAAGDESRSWKDLVLRNADDDLGFVACLKHGLVRPGNDELGERMMSFLKTGNLRELGQFHYAAVTQFEDVTRVVAVWTEGDFYPMSMFPEEGDAPGFDPSGLSRPPTGRRMLSAGEFGNEESLTIYIDCKDELPSLKSFYRRDFIRHGWRLLSDKATDEDGHLFLIQRGQEMRAVALSQEAGAAASVTIASTR